MRLDAPARYRVFDTPTSRELARALGIVLAHELVHVLMDSGDHPDEAGNLMRDDTAPRNTHLTQVQCARLRGTATSNGLLQPVR